jgi:hypothetical protein
MTDRCPDRSDPSNPSDPLLHALRPLSPFSPFSWAPFPSLRSCTSPTPVHRSCAAPNRLIPAPAPLHPSSFILLTSYFSPPRRGRCPHRATPHDRRSPFHPLLLASFRPFSPLLFSSCSVSSVPSVARKRAMLRDYIVRRTHGVPARVTDPKLSAGASCAFDLSEYEVQRPEMDSVAAKGQVRLGPVNTGPNQSRHPRHEPTITECGEAQAVG